MRKVLADAQVARAAAQALHAPPNSIGKKGAIELCERASSLELAREPMDVAPPNDLALSDLSKSRYQWPDEKRDQMRKVLADAQMARAAAQALHIPPDSIGKKGATELCERVSCLELTREPMDAALKMLAEPLNVLMLPEIPKNGRRWSDEQRENIRKVLADIRIVREAARLKATSPPITDKTESEQGICDETMGAGSTSEQFASLPRPSGVYPAKTFEIRPLWAGYEPEHIAHVAMAEQVASATAQTRDILPNNSGGKPATETHRDLASLEETSRSMAIASQGLSVPKNDYWFPEIPRFLWSVKERERIDKALAEVSSTRLRGGTKAIPPFNSPEAVTTFPDLLPYLGSKELEATGMLVKAGQMEEADAVEREPASVNSAFQPQRTYIEWTQIESKVVLHEGHVEIATLNAQAAQGSFKLDPARIAALQRETETVSAYLANIFNDNEAPTKSELDSAAEPEHTVALLSQGLMGLDEPHTAFALTLLSRRQWSRRELLTIAADLELMLDGALERINEASFDAHDISFIEGDDPIEVSPEILEKIAT